ncbi:MAG: murein biosynthesis integral membrane protein MurJ [bacterium]|nr:murein biosynthesis integral membrane protein MurJ [bacterium]MDZ4342239.1 murein biosynthesis integral membrane protein MurJ [Candidatus Binatia bacterium]
MNKNTKESQQTIGSASLISSAALGGALVGFLLQLTVAYFFGASSKTDAFFMAQSTSEMLSKLLLGGSITAVFLPMFVNRIAKNRHQEAWQLGLNILHVTGCIFIILITLLALFARPFVAFIAPGFDPVTTDLTVALLRIMLPSFLFLYLVDLAVSILYSLKSFIVPALLRVIAPAVSLIAVATLTSLIGIYSLAIGVLAGSCLQLLLVFWTLGRKNFHYRFVFAPLDPAFKKMLRLTYPFLFSVLVTQGAGIVYRVLVSDLSAGSLSSLKYAEKITQLLAIMFLNSITVVIFPLLSAKSSQQDFTGMRDTIGYASRLIFLITLPVIAGIIILRLPLISLLYQHGSFSAADTRLTSIALLFLGLGLAINGLSSILGHTVLALQETRAAVAVSISSQAVAIFLFVLLTPRMGVAGLALASSLVPLVIAGLYFLYLSRFIPRLHLAYWHSSYPKIIVLTVAMFFLLRLVFPLLSIFPDQPALSNLIQVIIPIITGAAFYLTAAYLWRIEEIHDIVAIAKNKLTRSKTPDLTI